MFLKRQTRKNRPGAVLARGAFHLVMWSVLASLLGLLSSAQTREATPTLTSIRELLDGHHPAGPALFRGSITYNGEELVVQDQTGAVAVRSATPVPAALGDQVEVRGALVMRQGIPAVDAASVRVLYPGSTPLPLAITPDEAAEGAYNGMLVAIDGEMIKETRSTDGTRRLTLDSGNQLFTCTLPGADAGAGAFPAAGAVVRCTGVLSFNQPDRALGSGTFLVLMRSAADLHLLTPAPWWTPRHLVLLFLLLLPLIALGYHIHLRNLKIRMQLVVEERSRIAREIHDTLAQGFAGIALQLQGVNRTLEPESTAASAQLAMALQMVRRSRAEAHRSIATLRSLHTYEDLAGTLDKLLRQLTGPAGLELTVEQQGTPAALSDDVTSQILRISQETIANTVEHAGAHSVHISLAHTPEQVIVEIRDDGHGFDPERAGSVDKGHFGIAGMRERAQQIRSTLTLHSGPQGTLVRLEVPVSTALPRYHRLLSRRKAGLQRLRRRKEKLPS